MIERGSGLDRAVPGHIVIRGVNWLGDAVMTTPALKRLRERFPHSKLTLFTDQKLAGIWEYHTAIDNVVTFSRKEGLFAAARRLRLLNADLALILPNSPRSALEAWLAKVPVRAGYARKWGNWFLTNALPRRPEAATMHKRSSNEVYALETHTHIRRKVYPASAHQVHEYLNLAAGLGATSEPVAPYLVLPQREVRAAAAKFNLTGPVPGARPLFGLNAGAEYGPAKRWPVDRFARAALAVGGKLDAVWLIVGGKADVPLAADLGKRLEHIGVSFVNTAGQTTLQELCGLLKLCRVLLTNDTGPMHVAAALGTPVVALFGSTSPELTGPGLPYDSRHQLLIGEAPCAPCFRRKCPIDLRCLHSLTPEQAAEAVLAAARS